MNALALTEWNPTWPFRRLMLSTTRPIWCLIDADDWWWISEHRWNWGWHASTPWKHYATRNTGKERSTLYLHRAILIRHDPRTEAFQWTHHVDHENGQSLDNRKANLRWLTPGENRAHRIPRSQIPSLDSIVRMLTVEAARTGLQQLEEIPF